MKRKPINWKSTMTAALALGVGANWVTMPQARAALAIDYGITYAVAHEEHPGRVAMNLAFYGDILSPILLFTYAPASISVLPLVLLDQKLSSLPPLSKQDLIENGFDEIQARRILEDGKNFEAAVSENEPFILEDRDTEASIRDTS